MDTPKSLLELIADQQNLDLYTDTISNNIILTTVVNNGNNIGISSIKIGETNND